MKNRPTSQAHLLLIALACCASGCQSLSSGGAKVTGLAKKLDFRDGLPWNREEEAREGNPARIVATWSDTVLHREGQGATRGFGGKLYFYDNKDTDPIAVKGQLVVYAFDETNRTPTDNCPTRRYVFPAEEVELHKGNTEFGVGYSFWLPWDGTDGPSTDVSLIARFEPLRGGGLVVSDQTRQRLPGKNLPTGARSGSLLAAAPAATGAAANGLQQVGGVQQAGGISTEKFAVQQAANVQVAPPTVSRKMQTTSIALPEGFRPSGNSVSNQKAKAPRTTRPAPAQPQSQTLAPEEPVPPVKPINTVRMHSVGESIRQQAGRPSFGSRPFERQVPASLAPSPDAAR